eukprot:CAMPEP_0113619424 /NCGR_PEP_ID=MMETSP0017_2-20120614/9862_1 /TAXON_ID=2856 /ORGANISM="Cylindrotheca closterium" /LENGTH=396 /DNA_ID=CAMNT_0000528997 /DNA_START=62 /DNA_END=1249 /DNA_ORIENTATION=+ /assembly_acc=CAM_ASM_000147
MPRKTDIMIPTKGIQADARVPRRHTYASSDKNNTLVNDLFAFSMHATDPTSEFFDEILASPTPNDMYLDSFHGDDTIHSAVGSLPLLSLDEDEKADDSTKRSTTERRKTLSRTKSKKKKKTKRLSSDSASSKKSISTKSKGKSPRRSSKSKKSKETPEKKSVAAMLKKLEEYEESLQEEYHLLQKERNNIAIERETLQLKMCGLESKLDELEDNDRTKPPTSLRILNNDALRIENAILLRRLQRQDEIILQLSNSSQEKDQAVDEKEDEESKEVLRLEKELSQAKELISKNEKIIKGQRLTIDRMKKESSSLDQEESCEMSLCPIQMIVGTTQSNKKDDGTAVTSSFEDSFSSLLGDSFSSLPTTTTTTGADKKKKSRRKLERGSSSSSIGRLKHW